MQVEERKEIMKTAIYHSPLEIWSFPMRKVG